jgi:hypothetical protein
MKISVIINYYNSYIKKNRKGSDLSKYILTTAGRVLFNQQIQQSIQEHFFQRQWSSSFGML